MDRASAYAVGMSQSSIVVRGVVAIAILFFNLPLLAGDKIDPDEAAGQADAKKDLANGKHKYIFALPEAFMFEFQDGDDSNLMDYYTAIMADKYGLTNEVVVVLPGPGNEIRHARGYDSVIDAEVDKKFGANTIDKAWKAACKMPKADRQKYLDQRKAAAATQAAAPATQKTH